MQRDQKKNNSKFKTKTDMNSDFKVVGRLQRTQGKGY